MLRQQQEEEQPVGAAVNERKKWTWFRKAAHEQTVAAVETNAPIPLETDTATTPVAALHRVISRRKKALRLAHVGTGIICAGLVVGRITVQGMEHPGSTVPGLLVAMGLVLGGDALLLASLLWGVRECRQAVAELANSDDLQAVGPLAEALTLADPVHSLAVSGLTRLFPQLQAGTDLLNATQIACLRRALQQSSNRRMFWRTNPHFAAVLQRALATLDGLPVTEQTGLPETAPQQAAHVESLLEQFRSAVRQRRKNTATIGASAALAATCSVGNVVWQGLTHGPANTPLLGVALGAMALTLGFTFRGLFRLQAMMNELADAGDLRVVGPLLDIAALQDGSGNTMAALLLTRLLPRLKASDVVLLTADQQTALVRTLTRNLQNTDYLIAALAALEQIGDGRALTVVEGLASGRLRTSEPKRVQAAAHACLPYLQIRSESRRASQTLLRASALSETSSETLLRPVQGVVETEASELLRPGTPRLEGEAEAPRRDYTPPVGIVTGGNLSPLAL